MRISDWSSDVCSSDLDDDGGNRQQDGEAEPQVAPVEQPADRQGAQHAQRDAERHIGTPEAEYEGALSAVASRRQQARRADHRSEEHTSELQSLMRNSYAVFCLKTKQT